MLGQDRGRDRSRDASTLEQTSSQTPWNPTETIIGEVGTVKHRQHPETPASGSPCSCTMVKPRRGAGTVKFVLSIPAPGPLAQPKCESAKRNLGYGKAEQQAWVQAVFGMAKSPGCSFATLHTQNHVVYPLLHDARDYDEHAPAYFFRCPKPLHFSSRPPERPRH